MNQIPVFDKKLGKSLGSIFKELRNQHGYTVPELIEKLEEVYGFKIEISLMRKIENNKSNIQIHQYLVLAHFYNLDNHELLNYDNLERSKMESKILTRSKFNPDFRWILETLLNHSEDFHFINHIKNVIKSTLALKNQPDGKAKSPILKAASPKKNKD